VHKTLQEFHKNNPGMSHASPIGPIRQVLLKIFNNYWNMAQDRMNHLGLTETQINFYHDDSEQMLLNYSCWFYKNGMPLPDLTEARILSENLGLLGIVDAVFEESDKIILVDYKTSKHAKITDDILRQAAIYSLLYYDRFKKIPDAIWVHFLKNPGDPVPIHVDDPLLDYAKILVQSVRKKTLSDNKDVYPCTCGGYCERDFIKS
jgi:hypothetical protein